MHTVSIYEPRRRKIATIACVNSKGSDYSAHSRSLARTCLSLIKATGLGENSIKE